MLGGRVLTSTAPPRAAVPPWQRRVGLLRQDPGLFPHLSVRANLGYGPRRPRPRPGRAWPSSPGCSASASCCAAMPARLSGGQAHRVALGRLLLAHCDALLLDEPYTGLDASLRRALTDLVVALVTARDVPAVLVAHELAEAQAFADRLAVLDRGRVLQAGAPDEVVLRPADPAGRRAGRLPRLRAGCGSAAGCRAGRWPGFIRSGPSPGRYPDRGAGAGRRRSPPCRPAGAGWEADAAGERAR